MTQQTLCMTPGPIEFESRVLSQFAHQGISHVDPIVLDVFGQCLEKMRHVFLASDGQPLIVSGSGTLGWDMIGANLVNTNDDVLVINTGYFGDHLAECLERYGAHVTHLHAPAIGHLPSLVDLVKVLTSGKVFKLITITQVDTSTGVLVPVDTLAATIRQHQPNALVVADSVCALGGEVMRMKDWDIDVVLTGSQKCIGVPAGLSLLVLRPRALQAYTKSTNTYKYYVDWHHWLPIMKSYEARKPSYFATPAVNHLFALLEGLSILLEQGGMEKRFKEHEVIGNAVKEAMKALGCTLVTSEDAGAHTLTCVRYPKGVSATSFLPKVYQRGVSLAGGLHTEIKLEYFRIGHMGPSTRRLDHVIKTVQAIEASLIECGHVIEKKGKAVEIIKQLQTQIPLKPYGCEMVYHGCPVPRPCQIYTVLSLAAAVGAGFLLAMWKK